MSFETKRYSGEIWEKLKETYDDLEENVARNTVTNYLSMFANMRHGLGIRKRSGYKGYWVDANFGVEASSIDNIADDIQNLVEGQEGQSQTSATTKKSLSKREYYLYEAAVDFLNRKGYSGFDSSNSRAQNRWGNPDAVGVKLTNYLNMMEIEVCSIEVKTSGEKFEIEFFEAVSHTRFVNKSYFAFAWEKNGTDIPAEMISYCEKFRIGLLVIEIESDDYKELFKNDKIKKSEVDAILEKYEFREVFPAPYHEVSLASKKQFLNGLKLKFEVVFPKKG